LTQHVTDGVGVGGAHPDHRGSGSHADTTGPDTGLTSGAVITVATAHQVSRSFDGLIVKPRQRKINLTEIADQFGSAAATFRQLSAI
jgi:hypothetical protein